MLTSTSYEPCLVDLRLRPSARRVPRWLGMRLHILLLAETSLKAPQVFKCKAACFEQMSHQRPGRATEERKQVIDQPMMGFLAADHRFKDMSVSNLASSPQCSLFLQPVDDGLHRCVRRSPCFW